MQQVPFQLAGSASRRLSSVAGRCSDERASAGIVPELVPTTMGDRLCAQLETDGPNLIFICAPTGFGKSALLRRVRQAAEGRRIATARIDCGEGDYLNARGADLSAFTGRQTQTLVLIDNADRAPEAVTPERLKDWARSSGQVRYVVASQALPDIDWLSLQLSGKAVLLRAEDLQLGPEEIERLLTLYSGRAVTSSVVGQVLELTEGWPLAVQVCGTSARNAKDWSLALRATVEYGGSLFTYLQHKVLDRLDASLCGFLFTLAPLDRFSAALCCDALGASGVRALLNEAIRRSLFIMPTAEPEWYRFHRTFRTFLLQRSAAIGRQDTRDVLEHARNWCLHQKRDSEAIEYSIRLGDLQLAKDMLLTAIPKCVSERGQIAEVVRWIDAVGCEASSDAALTFKLWKIFALVSSAQLPDAQRECALLESTPDFGSLREQEANAAMHLDLIRCGIAVKSDAMDEAGERALRWLHRYSRAPAFYRAIVFVSLAVSAYARNLIVDYRRFLDLAKRATAEAHSNYVDAWIGAVEASVELACGHAEVARRQAEDSIESALPAMGENCPIVSALRLLAARAQCEQGRMHDAEQSLAHGMAHFGDHGLVEAAIAGLEAAASIVEARSGATAALAEVRHHMRRGFRFAPRYEIEAARVVVLLLLRAGDTEAARLEFNSKIAGCPDVRTHPDENVRQALQDTCRYVEAVLLFAEGDHATVLNICSDLLPTLEAQGRMKRLVELRILKAAAMYRSGSAAMASKIFARALAIAVERGYLQTLCDLDWVARPLIGRIPAATSPSFVGELRRRIGLPPADPDVAEESFRPLTEREIEILELLDSGLGNQAAAQRLHLSLATVKWHVQNIYTKLGASNRSGALSRARRAGLLYKRR